MENVSCGGDSEGLRMFRIVCAFLFATCFFLTVTGATVFAEPHLNVVEVKYLPYPAEAGKDLNLWILLQNTGDKNASGVSCQLLEEFPFYLLPGENSTYYVGDLIPGKDALIQFRLSVDPRANEGWKELKVRCTASDGAIWVEKKLSIYVKVNRPELIVTRLSSSPSRLIPDTQENAIEVGVANVGDAPAYGVVAKLLLPDGFKPSYTYSDLVGLGTLKEGENKKATFYVDVDSGVAPGVYNATLILTYVERYAGKSYKKTIKEKIPLEIPPYPEVVITKYTTEPSAVPQGGEGKLKIIVKNVGEEKAESVSARVLKNSLVPISLDSRYDYVGTLEKGENGTAIFTFTVDENAVPKDYKLRIELRYLAGNNVITRDDYVTITVVSRKGRIYRDIAVVLLACAFIVVLLYGTSSRKKKKK